jgi:hypothetical protein
MAQLSPLWMTPDGLPGIPQEISQDGVIPLSRENVPVRFDVQMLADHLLRGQGGLQC